MTERGYDLTEFKVFISYNEKTLYEIEVFAEIIHNMLDAIGVKSFVAHLERNKYSEIFDDVVKEILTSRCFYFIFINSQGALEREAIKKEFKLAYPNGLRDKPKLLVLRYNSAATTNSDFEVQTGINLLEHNQPTFNDEAELVENMRNLIRTYKIASLTSPQNDFSKLTEVENVTNIVNLTDLQSYYTVDPNQLVKVNQVFFDLIKKYILKLADSKKPMLLLVTGYPGIGKSWMAYSIASELMKQGFLIYVITGSGAGKRITILNQRTGDDKKFLFLLDDHYVSLSKLETSLSVHDIVKIVTDILPVGIQKDLRGPILFSVRKDTWNKIKDASIYGMNIDENALSKIVLKVELQPLNQIETRLVVRSFYELSPDRVPPYPNLEVVQDIEEKIAERSSGNPIVIRLFFTDIHLRTQNNPYKIVENDVDNIISNAKSYALKIIFQYYFTDLRPDGFKLVLGFLYFLVKKQHVSLPHVLNILNEGNNEDLSNTILQNVSSIDTERMLPLFKVDEFGLIIPFHDIISDAIIDLTENPKKVLYDLRSEEKFITDNIKCITNIDRSERKSFLDPNINTLHTAYQHQIQKVHDDLYESSKISDENVYNMLSVFIEYSESANSKNDSSFVGELLGLLQKCEIYYTSYRDNVDAQLLRIFANLGLIEEPIVSLRKYYLQLLTSNIEKVRYDSWRVIPELLRCDILNKEDAINLRSHFLSLLESVDPERKKGSWIILTRVLLFPKIISVSDGTYLTTLLTSLELSTRWVAWKNVIYLTIHNVVTNQDISVLKNYYLDLMTDLQYCVDAWHNVTYLIEHKIIPLEEIISIKSFYIELLTRKELGSKFLFAWAGLSNLYNQHILTQEDKTQILIHLKSPDLQIRFVAWVALCKNLESNQVVNITDISPYKYNFIELLDNEKDNWELWNCLIILRKKGIIEAHEIERYVQFLNSAMTSNINSINIRSMTSLLIILALENNLAKIKILKERIMQLGNVDEYTSLQGLELQISLMMIPNLLKPKEVLAIKKLIFKFLNSKNQMAKITTWNLILHMIKEGLITPNSIIKINDIKQKTDDLFELLSSPIEEVIMGAWSTILFLEYHNLVDISKVKLYSNTLFKLLSSTNELIQLASGPFVEAYYRIIQKNTD